MRLSDRWVVSWIWPRYGEIFVWNRTRFNGGGYMFGAAPYTYWRIGPIFVKKYM